MNSNNKMILNCYGSGIVEAGGQQTTFYTQKSFEMLIKWLQP